MTDEHQPSTTQITFRVPQPEPPQSQASKKVFNLFWGLVIRKDSFEKKSLMYFFKMQLQEIKEF